MTRKFLAFVLLTVIVLLMNSCAEIDGNSDLDDRLPEGYTIANLKSAMDEYINYVLWSNPKEVYPKSPGDEPHVGQRVHVELRWYGDESNQRKLYAHTDVTPWKDDLEKFDRLDGVVYCVGSVQPHENVPLDENPWPTGSYEVIDTITVDVQPVRAPHFGTSPHKDQIIAAMEKKLQATCDDFLSGEGDDNWLNTDIYIVDFFEYETGANVWYVRKDGEVSSLPLIVEWDQTKSNFVASGLKGYRLGNLNEIDQNDLTRFMFDREMQHTVRHYVCTGSGLQGTVQGQPPVMPPKHRLEQISMSNEHQGWAVLLDHNAPVILRTDDGGENWQAASPRIGPSEGYKTYFLNEKTAWVAELKSNQENYAVTVHRTWDGGITWTSATFSLELGQSGQGLMNLYFANESEGWLMARYDSGLTSSSLVIYRTQDGGANWAMLVSADELQTSGMAGTLTFSDDLHAWIHTASTMSPFLYESKDEGRTWNEAKLAVPSDITGDGLAFAGQTIQFVNPQRGYYPVLIYDSETPRTYYAAYMTDDGGNTWTSKILMQANGGDEASASFAFTEHSVYFLKDQTDLLRFDEMDFVDDHLGWIAVGNGTDSNLYKTSDGGKSWAILEANVDLGF